MEATALIVKPGYCAECGQYPQSPEPSKSEQAGLSGINQKERISILVNLKDGLPLANGGRTRKIAAMQKVLDYFNLSKDAKP